MLQWVLQFSQAGGKDAREKDDLFVGRNGVWVFSTRKKFGFQR